MYLTTRVHHIKVENTLPVCICLWRPLCSRSSWPRAGCWGWGDSGSGSWCDGGGNSGSWESDLPTIIYSVQCSNSIRENILTFWNRPLHVRWIWACLSSCRGRRQWTARSRDISRGSRWRPQSSTASGGICCGASNCSPTRYTKIALNYCFNWDLKQIYQSFAFANSTIHKISLGKVLWS